ncbi:MAG: NADH:flavin oxidoreductase [Desulfobacteraceae bacterium]|nr:NADH:flavin oxidoreductase [Desulfobacteraceae bacterium]
MAALFEPFNINTMNLKNRFVRSATWEGLATTTGECTPELEKMWADLAEGGVGLIVTGHAYIEKRGQASPWQLGIDRDRVIPGLQRAVHAIHELGGKIALQLAHSGIMADPEQTGHPALAMSRHESITHDVQVMAPDDISEVVRAFAAAAVRAKRAGFDAVQIHGAHGYLLSQSLSPFYNRREDRFGGRIENRAAFSVAVVEHIRMAVGPDYPLLIKMNTADFLNGGMEVADAAMVAQLLGESGADAIELSGGTGASGRLNPVRNGIVKETDEAYFHEAATAFRKAVELPLILVGGIRSCHIAEGLIKDGNVDLIAMSRPFIREPDLVERWHSGNREKSRCISDSRCFVPARTGKGLYCVHEKRKAVNAL